MVESGGGSDGGAKDGLVDGGALDLCFGLREALEGVGEAAGKAEDCEEGSATGGASMVGGWSDFSQRKDLRSCSLSFKACFVKILQNWQEEVWWVFSKQKGQYL